MNSDCERYLKMAIASNKEAKRLNGNLTLEGQTAYGRKAVFALKALVCCASCKSGSILRMRPHRKKLNTISVSACEPLCQEGFDFSFHLCVDALLEIIEEEYLGREDDKRDLYDLLRGVMREVLGDGRRLTRHQRRLYRRYVLNP